MKIRNNLTGKQKQKKRKMIRKNKLDKKAGTRILPEHLVNFLIAVICIGILIYAGYKFYSYVKTNSEFEQAEGTLDNIMNAINSLKEPRAKTSVIVYEPIWSIFAFSEDDKNLFQLPTSCRLVDKKGCLCICDLIGKEASRCEGNEGICKELDWYVDVKTIYFYKGQRIPIPEEPTRFLEDNYILIPGSKMPIKLEIGRYKKGDNDAISILYAYELSDELYKVKMSQRRYS